MKMELIITANLLYYAQLYLNTILPEFLEILPAHFLVKIMKIDGYCETIVINKIIEEFKYDGSWFLIDNKWFDLCLKALCLKLEALNLYHINKNLAAEHMLFLIA